MQTDSSLEELLKAVSDSEEQCDECAVNHPEQTLKAEWELHTSETCRCLPNPLLLCEPHKRVTEGFMDMYGAMNWDCCFCGHTSALVWLTAH